MHELSIAESILATVLDAAEANDAKVVNRVDLLVGEMQLVVEDALQMAWGVLIPGTIASKSELVVIEEKILMACDNCDAEYPAAIDNYICPTCGKAEATAIQGDNIRVTSLLCDAEE